MCVQQAAGLLSLGAEVDTQVVVIAAAAGWQPAVQFSYSWMIGSTASTFEFSGVATR